MLLVGFQAAEFLIEDLDFKIADHFSQQDSSTGACTLHKGYLSSGLSSLTFSFSSTTFAIPPKNPTKSHLTNSFTPTGISNTFPTTALLFQQKNDLYLLKMNPTGNLPPLQPTTNKPATYLDIPLIRDAISIVDTQHHEADVERVVNSILQKYFPQSEGWSLVPEFLVPEGKRPDILVEKYNSAGSVRTTRERFVPRIFLELKSGKGASLERAMEQATSSLVTITDRMTDKDFSLFLAVVKGNHIGFFEYHNDRRNLYEDRTPQCLGAVPFNLVPRTPQTPPGRPYYPLIGTGRIPCKVDVYDKERKDMPANFLEFQKDDALIQEMFNWMNGNNPSNIT